jgi:glycosyltransferase involved in cell wall biosynthesis
MKKKVLHIVEAMGGGVFTYLVELANGTCDEFDITIAYGLRDETPKDYESYFDDKIKLICVKNFTRGLNPIKDTGAWLELRKIIDEVNPDIMHMHSSKAGAIGRIMFSGKKRKMFYTPHGYSFLMQDISPVKRKIFKAIEYLCGMKKCTTVACGESEWEQSKSVTDKSIFISNGINIERLQRVIDSTEDLKEDAENSETNIEDAKERTLNSEQNRADIQNNGLTDGKKITVYTVGRINDQKNPELFNKIAKKLPQIEFVWIGDGEKRSTLTSANIRVTGWMDNYSAMKLAREYDLFVLASRYEGLAISLLEAMYMKKTCIVSNVVGNRDVIMNNYNGYVCNNVEEFVEVISMLDKDGVEKRIGENAHKDILGHFNSNWLVEKYTELYNE